MKKITKKVITLGLTLSMMVGVLAGCGSKESDDKTPEGNKNGGTTVTIAVDTARATDYEALFDSMKQAFPNLEIKFDYFSHTEEDSAAEYLSTRAAAGKLPDIVWDEAGTLPLYVTQGWVYPLDEFVAGDPDFEYIPKNLIKDYTYCGKLYALPHQAHYELTYVNEDLLNKLNLDMPSLNWTPEDFETYLKAASTSEYSGIEKLFMIPNLLTDAFDPNTTQYGYNYDSRQLEMGGFVKAVQYMVRLRQIPGLEAWALRRNSSGEVNDYVKKFGTNEDNAAFDKGLTLFHGVGSWELASAKTRWEGRNWSYWTVPQSSAAPGCMPIHIDHCFMTSSCQNPKEAFQVLRYLTYSKEGNIARLSMYDAENEGKYATMNNLYYPTTLHPEVLDKFSSLPNATDLDMFLLKNIENSKRMDTAKIVPSWKDILANYVTESVNTATDGTEAMVEATLNEMASKANPALSKAWADFEAKVAEVQKDFDSAHPAE